MILELGNSVSRKLTNLEIAPEPKFPLFKLRLAWDDPNFKLDSIEIFNFKRDASFGDFIRAMRDIPNNRQSLYQISPPVTET